MGNLLLQTVMERFDEFEGIAAPLGFAHEIVDFALPFFLDGAEAQKRLSFYEKALKNRNGRRFSMHGVFMDIQPQSQDPYIREASRKRISENLTFAGRLGIDRIVFHSGYNPLIKNRFYDDSWLEGSAEYWKLALQEFGGTILIENMFDDRPDMLLRLMEDVACERLRICLDVGHCQCFSRMPLEKWFELAPYIDYFHLNDNRGQSDEHLSVGAGSIDWTTFNGLARSLGSPDALLELSDAGKVESALQFMEKNRIYPL
ncbi:MAG: sugar phosphate isomerase/epimerase [Candidatus Wallbacteria bacterium]|nr:sugar phosphate isomerase/epimerase [Candidatus Wallbacteria bacterium]